MAYEISLTAGVEEIEMKGGDGGRGCLGSSLRLRKLQILNKLIQYIQIFMYCIRCALGSGWEKNKSQRVETVMLGDVI